MTSFQPFRLAAASAAILAGAMLGYNSPEVECVRIDSPSPFCAGSPATVRFLLRNKTKRPVELRPRSAQCGARLQGVPNVIHPFESREVQLVVNTAGRNGSHRFAAGISTDAHPRLIPVVAEVDIHADWVVRRVTLGTFPERGPVTKRIRIDNVPARNLARVGMPAQRGWSARLVVVGERFVDVDLSTASVPLEDRDSGRFACSFSLYFADADVRRVQVLAYGVVAADTPRSDLDHSTTLRGNHNGERAHGKRSASNSSK